MDLFISLFFRSHLIGVKRVTWPPENEYNARASQQRQSPALNPQVNIFYLFFAVASCRLWACREFFRCVLLEAAERKRNCQSNN